MKVSIVKGATSVLLRIFIQDSSSTIGAGLTGLVFNSAGLTCYRMRDDDGNAGATAISLATATLGTWASGGFKEKDATNAAGWYEFGITNAAIATGSRTVGIHLKGATNMAPLPIEIELTGWDNQDAVHGGMSALPNTAVTTNASLLTSGSGTDQVLVASGKVVTPDTQKVDVNTIKTNPVVNGGTFTFPTNSTGASTTNITAGTITTVTTVTNQLTAAAIATGIWQDATAGDFTAANSIGKSVMNGVSLGTGLTVARVTLADTLTTYTGNTPQTGDSYALASGANGFVAIKGDTAAIKVTTDKITFTVANQVDSNVITKTGFALSAGERQAIADAWTARNVAGGSSAGRTNGEALAVLRNKTEIVAGTLNVYDTTDGGTPLWTAAVATTAGNPISSIDPA